jgi:ketosteroid isomerase-like protein
MGGVGVPEEDNVERVRQAFEAIEREGWEALFPLIDPEVELTTPPELAMEPDTYHGTDGLRRYFESFEDAMKDIRIVPEGEFLAAGDKVFFPFRLSARGRRPKSRPSSARSRYGRCATARACAPRSSPPAKRRSRRPGCRPTASPLPPNLWP